MLNLEYILKFSRMMKQTGGQYRGFLDDHSGEKYPSCPFRPDEHSGDEDIVEINLDYECGSDGNLRIVQR
jgi:hypothetical protein